MKSSRAGKGGEPGSKAEKHERKDLSESASPETVTFDGGTAKTHRQGNRVETRG